VTRVGRAASGSPRELLWLRRTRRWSCSTGALAMHQVEFVAIREIIRRNAGKAFGQQGEFSRIAGLQG
jgi:hypothetical protein